MTQSPFDRSGFASRDDLDTSEWKSLFSELEQAQKWFANAFDRYRSPAYTCKTTPLFDFSRCWEYPYVYYHLLRLFPAASGARIVDHGCGVTFFPFYLARKGFDVTGVDIDSVTEADFCKAASLLPDVGSKSVFKKVANGNIPLPDGSVDAVYSISVLEHIPEPHKAITDIARILRQKGIFVLTMDIDLVGNMELTPGKYKDIMAEIKKHFNIVVPETSIHPRSLITTKNSPYPFVIHQSLAKRTLRVFWELAKPLLRLPKAVFPHVAVCAYVLEKK